MASPTLVWFRDDLRIHDHPALHVALERGRPVIALFVLDEESPGVRALGGAAKWWLHHSLLALRERLEEIGGALVLRRGQAEEIVPAVAEDAGAELVVWNRRYGGAEREIDARIKQGLVDGGIEAHSLPGSLLTEPWQIQTGQGEAYRVYTPFANACQSRFQHEPPRVPLEAPDALPHGSKASSLDSDPLDSWELLPTRPDWAEGLREEWTPGEHGAHERLEAFLDGVVGDYKADRDRPDLEGTSRLSPHLRWGEISSAQAWHALEGRTGEGAATFRRELLWREFAWHTLYSFPELHTRPWRAAYEDFPWPELDRDALDAWQRGSTGVPIVDAGMRELWRTGSMHNRIRMVTASFLTKHLLTDWRRGEEWFWDTLVDADQASNPFNWQWVAGSGVDAAPYFRVFNPERQAERFDPHGAYVQRWVPEAGSDEYPEPIVGLKEGREAALAAWREVR
ncbi:cryptochrome/photolyase family protein [Pseudoclavibacter sp. VKM Ac-2888]|uniref:cryptochrome/photolyase family protein n=1 Tax=Pseudoclavibacter sp. VKM Ac-2888 TaxID=2783830 RepID=UPI00188ADEF4|nr:deoxyribodipyrimidine photo-lyase [Pseudoclavibacter sp. VKM Ac-2888]MBF4548806.1 deoxyribodipyrimidine photo-lyase [Pseudoclavibacter sp. VKM Ac-2888]